MSSREEKQAADVEEGGSGRVMPKRATRGKRMTALVENEVWQQEEVKQLFAEDEDDEDYEAGSDEEREEQDIVDSDFDAPEVDDEPEETDEDYEEKPKRGRKRKAAERKTPAKRGRKGSRTAADAGDDEDGERPKKRPRVSKAQQLANLAPRKSSRPQTMERTMAREMREAVEKQREVERPRKKRKRVYRILTQEEQLKRAEKTERENKLSLEWLMYVEEEKKKVKVRKVAPPGPRIVFRSIRVQDPHNPNHLYERSFVTWTGVNDLPGYLHQPMRYPRPKPKCILHGEAGCGIDDRGRPRTPRYKEPKSGYVYCSIEALEHLRKVVKQQAEEEAARKAAAAASMPQASPGTTIAYDSEGRPYEIDLEVLRTAPLLVMAPDGTMVPVTNKAEVWAALGLSEPVVAPAPIVPPGVPMWLAQYVGAQVTGSDGQIYDAVALALAQAAAALNAETYLIAPDPDNPDVVAEFYAVIGSDGGEMLVPAEVARNTPVFVDLAAAHAAASGDPASQNAYPPPPLPETASSASATQQTQQQAQAYQMQQQVQAQQQQQYYYAQTYVAQQPQQQQVPTTPSGKGGLRKKT